MDNRNIHKAALVIGDIILDRTYCGLVERISPEAPCLVFRNQNDVVNQLGGAAYVASQLAALSINVYLCGIIANDKSGEKIKGLLENSRIDTSLVSASGELTTTKTRYVVGTNKQQVFRVDTEQLQSFNLENRNHVLSFIRKNSDDIGCVVLVDYEKGVLDSVFCQEVIQLCKQLSIHSFVDIKSSFISKYSCASIIKGNEHEIRQMFLASNLDMDDYLGLKKKIACSTLIVTCGEKGIIYVGPDDIIRHDDATRKRLFDVTGAGDVVTSFYVASLLYGFSCSESIANANKAAGVKVGLSGCPIISWKEMNFNSTKLISIENIKSIKEEAHTIVFTNGCFDVLHAGHIDLLKKASSLGDCLVVGLNSDSSIRRIKGDERPINDLESRIIVLSAIECVDYIIVFEEDTPLSLIQKICPNVLAKGGDYTKDEVVGAEFVESNGGDVVLIPIVHDLSSSMIINKTK